MANRISLTRDWYDSELELLDEFGCIQTRKICR